MSLVSLALEHSEDIIAIGALVGGLLFNRSRKASEDDLWELMLKVGNQMFPRLLADPRLHDDEYVRGQIVEGIWSGLERFKVKRTKARELLVMEAADYVKSELAAKLTDELLRGYINVSDHTALVLKDAQTP